MGFVTYKAEESLPVLLLLFFLYFMIFDLSTFTLLQIELPLVQAAPEVSTLAVFNLHGFLEDVHSVASQILKQEAI